ncbi:MAG: hypothetical protein GX224_06975 [Thermoplasmatales archaeon]|nr:hypothetical protein [Thermoplasmatales archaeon]
MAKSADKKKDYAGEYNKQTVSVSSHVVYTPPEGGDDDAHTGLPECYPCCGPKCTASCLGLAAVLVVCCAYVSQDGQCCTYCQWPF